MLPAPAPRMPRSRALLVLSLFIAAFVLVNTVIASGAAQASTYRFWNFWTVDSDSWVYSQLGPASTFPEDGSVQGWVFAATDADSPSIPPDITPAETFDQACAGVSVGADEKRVAIVLDSGTIDIAPSGQVPPVLEIVCAVGSVDANGYELLNSAAELRTDNGFICAINGYPAMECSAEYTPAEVSTSATAAAETDSAEASSSESNALAPLGTAFVIGLVAVAGFYFWRRRSA